jgi:ribosomal protein S18 acetylase RimI-like enzyme
VGVAINQATIRVRRADEEDLEFLWDMLYEAVHWDPDKPDPKPPREEVLSWPGIAHYLEGWGRPEDFALIALDPADSRRVGAAWYRLMSPEDPGYGFVDDSTPEVGIAVVSEVRSLGVGGTLLRALMVEARSRGFGALSLSVERGNLAIHLYERHGFEKLFIVGDAWTMKADLSRADGE